MECTENNNKTVEFATQITILLSDTLAGHTINRANIESGHSLYIGGTNLCNGLRLK
jgi:hypothetical protein